MRYFAAALAVLAVLTPVASADPYDPRAIFNQPAMDAATDINSGQAVGALTGFVRSNPTKLHLKTSGEVPALNVSDGSDAQIRVTCGNLDTTFKSPVPPLLGTGLDHPTEIIQLWTFREIRCWRATFSGNTLDGQGGSLSYWNNDGEAKCPDGSLSLGQPCVGGGAGNGLTYFAGLVTGGQVSRGIIKHAVRVAGNSSQITSSFRPPARKSDQSGSVYPMGSIFVLMTDCTKRTVPGLPDDSLQTQFLRNVLCPALRDYGLMISDGAGSNLSFYLEDDITAGWAARIGDKAGHPSYSWIIRPGPKATDGLPWDQNSWRLTAEPASYTDR